MPQRGGDNALHLSGALQAGIMRESVALETAVHPTAGSSQATGKIRVGSANPCGGGACRFRYAGVMKTILVPVDLSAESTAVCDAACELARAMGASLRLFHVVQPPPVMVTEIYALDTGQAEEMLVAAERVGEERLHELGRRCAERGVSARTLHRVGLPVPEILAQAAEADYIVLGSHGHGAMYDLLVGSTAHGVLRKAPCPVIVVPPKHQPAR